MTNPLATSNDASEFSTEFSGRCGRGLSDHSALARVSRRWIDDSNSAEFH